MRYIIGPDGEHLAIRGKGAVVATKNWNEFLNDIYQEKKQIEFETKERLYQETRPSRATGMVQESDNTYYPGNDFTDRRFQSFWE